MRESKKFSDDLKHFHFFGKALAEVDSVFLAGTPRQLLLLPAFLQVWEKAPRLLCAAGLCAPWCVLSLWQSPVPISSFKSLYKGEGLGITRRKCKWKPPLFDPLVPKVFANKDSLCKAPLKVAVGGQEENQLSNVWNIRLAAGSHHLILSRILRGVHF